FKFLPVWPSVKTSRWLSLRINFKPSPDRTSGIRCSIRPVSREHGILALHLVRYLRPSLQARGGLIRSAGLLGQRPKILAHPIRLAGIHYLMRSKNNWD